MSIGMLQLTIGGIIAIYAALLGYCFRLFVKTEV
jgi:hypothetical protein